MGRRASDDRRKQLSSAQPHKTLMAQGLEQLGASETLTDMLRLTNTTGLANISVKNSARLNFYCCLSKAREEP